LNTSLYTSARPLKVRIAKVADGKAELVFPDNQTVTISAKYLPHTTLAGKEFFLNLLSHEDLALSKKEIAKEVLKEILE